MRADIGGRGGTFKDTFWVTTTEGAKVADRDLPAVQSAIEVSVATAAKPATAIRPKLNVPGASEDRQELLHTLMDTYVKNDVLSIQQSIVNRECRPPSLGRVVPLFCKVEGGRVRAGRVFFAQQVRCRRRRCQPWPPSPHAVPASLFMPGRRGVHHGSLPLQV